MRRFQARVNGSYTLEFEHEDVTKALVLVHKSMQGYGYWHAQALETVTLREPATDWWYTAHLPEDIKDWDGSYETSYGEP